MKDMDMKENLQTIIDNNKSKDNLANIDLHKTRELLMEVGAILLDVRPPAKVSGENAQEAYHKCLLHSLSGVLQLS